MAKRFGRTLVDRSTATRFSYDARVRGSDHADAAGNCQSPVMISLTGMRDRRIELLQEFNRPWHDSAMVDGKNNYIGPGFSELPAQPRHIDLAVRCRKCEACQRSRQHHWRMRAQLEIGNAHRTWFGTLTLCPERQFYLVATARDRLRRAGTNYDDLCHDEQFIENCKELVAEMQRYLKRLRKDKSVFRYLWVIERHKSGAPHVHILVHEKAEPVRHKTLTKHWSYGFSKFNLVAQDEKTKIIYYVAKYLTKALTRPYASLKYGHTN